MNRSSKESHSIGRDVATGAGGPSNMPSPHERREQTQNQDETSNAEQKMMPRAAAPFPTVATNFPPPHTTSGLERIGFLDAPDRRFIPPSRTVFDAMAETKKPQSSESLSVSPAMEEKPLPKDFQPSEFTVIIGRGKKIRESQGNVHLRTLASTYLTKYSVSRQAKTEVVNNILGIIRAVCPSGGAFVRCEQGQWYEVSDRVAREKVGYVFRDLLSDKYESSCKSKTAKRKRQQQEIQELQQKQFQEEQLRQQMAQMQQRILMRHQQQPLNVANMATFPPRVERNVQRSFSDSGFSNMLSSMHTTPPQFDTSFLPPQNALNRSISAPFPPTSVRSLPSSPFMSQRHGLQQEEQSTLRSQQHFPQQQKAMDMNMPVYTTSPLKFDSKSRMGHLYSSCSDCSEASNTGSGLDDSSHTAHGSDALQSPSLPNLFSRLGEEDQKPPVARWSIRGMLSRVTEGEETDLSSLLTSPLIDCHISQEDQEDSVTKHR